MMTTNLLVSCFMVFNAFVKQTISMTNGRSSQCTPSLSLSPDMPEAGQKITLTATYCEEKDGDDITWKQSTELLGTCARTSCGLSSRMTNDPSSLKSTLTIEHANIAYDIRYFKFQTSNRKVTLSKRIYIYKHPKFISTNLDEINLKKQKSVEVQVNSSCMYPPPTLIVYLKTDGNSSPQQIKSKVANVDNDQECEGLEVSTSTFLEVDASDNTSGGTGGTIVLGLHYGEYINKSVKTLALIGDDSVNGNLTEKSNFTINPVMIVTVAWGMFLWCCISLLVLLKDEFRPGRKLKMRGLNVPIECMMRFFQDVIIIVVTIICFSYLWEVTEYGTRTALLIALVGVSIIMIIKLFSFFLILRRIYKEKSSNVTGEEAIPIVDNNTGTLEFTTINVVTNGQNTGREPPRGHSGVESHSSVMNGNPPSESRAVPELRRSPRRRSGKTSVNNGNAPSESKAVKTQNTKQRQSRRPRKDKPKTI